MPSIQGDSFIYVAVWGRNMDSLLNTGQEAKFIYDEAFERNYEANLER